MTDPIQILHARLERAERRARLGMFVGLGVACLALLVAASGIERSATVGEGGAQQLDGIRIENGVIHVRGLVVEDADGRSRIELGDDPGVQRQAEMFGVVIRDANGAERFGVGVNAQDSVVLGMDAAVGVGSPMRDRLALVVGPDGSASVRLIDNLTTVPVELFSLPGGGGGVRLRSYDPAARTLSTRALTFDGEGETHVRKVGGD